MGNLENMPGHTRLYRRGAVYYHRAAVPKDIAESYPKAEETFSLKTKDYANTDMRHSHWHWLPLLGLFTGARLNELCQLYVADVRSEGGIPYLRLTNEGEGQRIKGKGDDIRSRDVPLHRELIRLGFWEFAEDQRQGGQTRLFDQLKADASGYFSGKLPFNKC